MIEIYTLTASSSSSSSSSNGTKNKSDELDASSFDLRSARSKRIELCTSVVAKLSPIQHFSRLLTPLPLLLFPALTPTSALSLKKEASWEIPEEEEVRSSRRGWTNSTQTKEKFLGGNTKKMDGPVTTMKATHQCFSTLFFFSSSFSSERYYPWNLFLFSLLPTKILFVMKDGKQIWAADFVLGKVKRRTIFSKHGQTVGLCRFFGGTNLQSDALSWISSAVIYILLCNPSHILWFHSSWAALNLTSHSSLLNRFYGSCAPLQVDGISFSSFFSISLCIHPYIHSFLPSFLPSPVRSLFFSTIGQNLS